MKRTIVALTLLAATLHGHGQSIANASFEDGTNGWTVSRMQLQTNNAISPLKAGSTYIERWTSSANLLGAASVTQTVSGLANGVYRLTAAAMNIAQSNEQATQVGAWLVGNGLRTDVTALATYTLDFFVTDGTAHIGFVCNGASGNWVGCDNFTLTYLGTAATTIQAAANTVKSHANSLLASYGSDTQYAALVAQLTTAISGGQLATVAQAAQAVVAGERPYRLRHPAGLPPTVTTDQRHARGSAWIFGRLTRSGSNVVEEGFCYSTSPQPTLDDGYTTDWIDSHGKVFWMQDLKPATIYYIRAYAMTKDYAVGYGDVVKVPTLPKGNIQWSYGNEGDQDVNDRISSAATLAFDHYWNNLTQITTFRPSLHYASGTPTADCSYGGWMRIGPNVSYQRAGTIMHEALHGVGVGTHAQWGEFIRNQQPVWDVLRFWDNDDSAVLSGDGTHLWPYGINGAHEDTGTDQLYIGNALICEALGESGLPPTDSQWLLPYYAFRQDDDTKYYFKCESKDRGLATAYLVESGSGALQWKVLTAQQARQDASKAAWHVTFDAATQRYHVKNAATGHYLRYADGFTTGATPTDIQMKKCRVDVSVGALTYQGYSLIDHASRQAMEAKATGTVGAADFSIVDEAATQRWLIIADDALDDFESAAAGASLVSMKQQLVSDGFTQAMTLPTQKSLYFFLLGDHERDLLMTLRNGNHQGADNKAMWYDKDANPRTDRHTLWTIDDYTQDGTTYQILANATHPDYMLQTEWNASWHYRCSDNGGGSTAWGRTTFACQTDGYWTIQNGVYPENRFLGPWEDVITDDAETALNKSGSSVGHFDLFTILRGDYVKRFQTGLQQAAIDSPADISYVLENPGGERRTTIGWQVEGADWQTQGSDAMTGKVGSYFFERWASSGAGTTDIGQEVRGLPDGYYRFSAIAFTNAQGQDFHLYANDSQQTAQASNSGARTSVIAKVSDGTLRVGLRAVGVSAQWIAFDDARLEYIGQSSPCDVNRDGSVTVADAVAIVSIVVGGSDSYRQRADVNSDGTVSIADACAVVDYIVSQQP